MAVLWLAPHYIPTPFPLTTSPLATFPHQARDLQTALDAEREKERGLQVIGLGLGLGVGLGLGLGLGLG